MAFIRAREVETEIKNRGTERGTLYVLQVLAEQQIALQKDAREMALMLDKCIDLIATMTVVGENMKSVIQKIGVHEDDDNLDRNTLTLGDKKSETN